MKGRVTKSFDSIDLINMFESEECDIAESDGYECTFGFLNEQGN